MKTRLKEFRVAADLTQTKLAAAVGVSQPNYQRWETGSTPIPTQKLEKLTKILKADADALLGRHKPIEVSLYDDTASDDTSYYGEVAVHFLGKGEPVLFSISEAQFKRLHKNLQSDTHFVSVESLGNETVIIRTGAVSDIYFSSEAYDDYGPEHHYDNHVDARIVDPRDWEIIECLAADGEGTEEFDALDVDRVQNMVMITEDQYEKLLADGLIPNSEIENERVKNQKITDRIFDASRLIIYQLSNGARRQVYADNYILIADIFAELVEFDDNTWNENMIRLEAEGRHRIVFINKRALDYMTIPTHQLKIAQIDLVDSILEEEGAAIGTATNGHHENKVHSRRGGKGAKRRSNK